MRPRFDTNKVVPYLPALCLEKFSVPGGKKPGPPDIIVQPIEPDRGFTGPPGGGGGSITGPTFPIERYCKCFPHLAGPPAYSKPYKKPGFNYICIDIAYKWKQTCEWTNKLGEWHGKPGMLDPFLGWADIFLKIGMACPATHPIKNKVVSTGFATLGKLCKNKLKQTCDLPCPPATMTVTCCVRIDPPMIPPVGTDPGGVPGEPGGPIPGQPGGPIPGQPGGPVPGQPGGPTPGQPGGPTPGQPGGPITGQPGGPTPGEPGSLGSTSPGWRFPRSMEEPHIETHIREVTQRLHQQESSPAGRIKSYEEPTGLVGPNNLPLTPIDPYHYGVKAQNNSSIYTTDPYITSIPSCYNTDIVFHLYSDPHFLAAATVTQPKGAGDPNNILIDGEINKVLKDCLIPKGATNHNVYSDKTLSLVHYRLGSLMEQYLSDATRKSLHLVDRYNIVSTDLSTDIKSTLGSSLISGNLQYYSPQLIKEIAKVGIDVLGETVPPAIQSPVINRINGLTYISRNLESLYPASFKDDGDECRFAAHWLTLPPEYYLGVSVTPRVGEERAVPISLNFDFPVYERDGSERKVKETLDFLSILDKDGVTERIVALGSARSNLHTLDRVKESRSLRLLAGSHLVQGNKITTTYQVTEPNGMTAALDYELNTTPLTLKESYLFQLQPDTLVAEKPGGDWMHKYSADYSLVWSTGDSDETFNNALKMRGKSISGPHRIAYFPVDPFWHYLVNNETMKVTFDTLNLEGYLPGMPEAIVASQVPYTIMVVPTDMGEKASTVKRNFFNGRSVLQGFEVGTATTRTFTTMINPFIDSESYVKAAKDPTEIDLQGDRDIFTLQFEKSFNEGDLSTEALPDDTPVTTRGTPIEAYVNRVNTLKSNYNLEYDGVDTLTQFDLYKGFPLNTLISILTDNLGDLEAITGVRVILNKARDVDTPTTFIADSDLATDGVADTVNYIGEDKFPQITYFPSDFNYYY